MQEALSLGARGYVVKTQAGAELLAAVEAVLQGKQFVSSGSASQYFTDAADAQAPDRLRAKEVLASPAPSGSRKTKISRSHEVQFYSDDASFLKS